MTKPVIPAEAGIQPKHAVLQTPRLSMRRFTLDDADFILELLNDPAWIEHIGDRGVRTLEDARAYMAKTLFSMYDRLGFGLYLVSLNESRERIGMCGLVKRDGLDDVDIGFAFLPAHRGKGYAVEAAAAVLVHAREDFGLDRVVAIVSEANPGSIRVLQKIGLRPAGRVKLPRDGSPSCSTPREEVPWPSARLHPCSWWSWPGAPRRSRRASIGVAPSAPARPNSPSTTRAAPRAPHASRRPAAPT